MDQYLIDMVIRDGISAVTKNPEEDLPKKIRLQLWKSIGPRKTVEV